MNGKVKNIYLRMIPDKPDNAHDVIEMIMKLPEQVIDYGAGWYNVHKYYNGDIEFYTPRQYVNKLLDELIDEG